MKRFALLTLALLVCVSATGCSGQKAAATPNTQAAMGSIHPPGWGRPAPRYVLPEATAPGTTAVMFDTIDVATVPPHPFALAGYTAGRWPDYIPLRRAFPTAHTISIAIASRYHADCADVEPGDLTAAEAPAWVHADIAAGFPKPCVYSSWWEFHDEVIPALERAHIKRESIYEIDADYTYRPHIDVGFDGTQWTDKALGRNLDESLVTRSFLSIAEPPLKPTNPHHRELLRLYGQRRALRNTLQREGCIHLHPNSPRCHRWHVRLRGIEAHISTLHHHGVW